MRSLLRPPLTGRLIRVWILLSAVLGPAVGLAVAAEVGPLFSQRNWTRTDGLPDNQISSLCEDRSGYLWIGTWTGLARFDGSRFLRYEYVPPGQLAATGFAAIAADPADDAVWAAPHSGGLLRFQHGRFDPQTLPEGHSAQRIARLFVAADGALWIAFEGGDVLRLQGDRHELFGAAEGLGPTRSTQFASDGNGRVWLANGPQLFWHEAGTLYPMPLPGITENLRLASARQDGPWLLTRGWLHKMVDGRLGLNVEVNSGMNARSVQALLEDSTGAIWTGTRARGVRRLTINEQRSDLIIEEPEDVGVLLEDGSGNIWIGANGRGLLRLRSGVVRRFDKSQGLLERHTLGVCEDNAGTVWIANRDGGVSFLSGGRIHTLAPPRMRDTFSARSLAPSGPEGVLVTTSNGLMRATLEGLVPLDAPGAPPQPPKHGEMRVTHLARNGDLWLDLDPGRVGRLRDGSWQVFTTDDGLGPGAPQVITEDARGRIWIGMEDSQLYCFDGTRFAPVPLAAPAGAGAIQALHFDGAGTGWIGTAGAGLLRLGDPAARNLGKSHGLPSSNLSQVISDDQGSLWCGSPEGIFRVGREELGKFFAGTLSRVDAVVLTADDGLGETNCASDHQPSVWKGRDGVLWFATRQGVVAIDPRREKMADTPLVVKIDAVRTGEQSWPGTAPVRVPALNRSLELDYSILSLSAPDRVRARSRLLGYDDDWAPLDGRGLARYARLPPGEYQFLLEARLAGVPGTATRASVTIVVPAAWWQTLWFRLGVAGGVLLLGGLAVRAWSNRRLRARLAQLEQASALERERSRIAQNIHDDLGSGLTRISLLTQAAEPVDGRGQLDKIYRTVSSLTQSMDEIVWAVNPKNDNLENFANYLVEFAQGFLTDADIRCRVELPETLPACLLPAQFRHHLFLSCKEALNNVAKHAHATEVTVQLRVEAGRLVVALSDNGLGLAAAKTAGSAGRPEDKDGLANMRARLAVLGGSCEIASSATGTTVTFTAPLPASSPFA